MLEVDIVKMLDNQAKGKDEAFDRIMAQLRQAATRRNVDVFDELRAIAGREHASLNRYWGDAGQTDEAIVSRSYQGRRRRRRPLT